MSLECPFDSTESDHERAQRSEVHRPVRLVEHSRERGQNNRCCAQKRVTTQRFKPSRGAMNFAFVEHDSVWGKPAEKWPAVTLERRRNQLRSNASLMELFREAPSARWVNVQQGEA
jgi:hypothetical protein